MIPVHSYLFYYFLCCRLKLLTQSPVKSFIKQKQSWMVCGNCYISFIVINEKIVIFLFNEFGFNYSFQDLML